MPRNRQASPTLIDRDLPSGNVLAMPALFAQLVDDPSSLPDQFPTPEAQDAERKRLFAIIEDLVKWENSTNEEVLERARAEIRRSCGGERKMLPNASYFAFTATPKNKTLQMFGVA